MIILYYNYKPFDLEKWIETFYTSLNITKPEQICENTIAYALDIDLKYTDKPCYSYENNYVKIININKMLPSQLQREHFFHELGHILRHAGSQLILPKSFIELQEFDSKRFTKYAALPYSMLLNYDLECSYIDKLLAIEFKVSEKMCLERVDNIKNKIVSETLFYTK